MRFVFGVLLVVSLFVGVANAAPVPVSGRVVVIFGDGAWNRNANVVTGVMQALSTLDGVTPAVPKNGPFYSLRDADLSGIDYVVEIYQAEIQRRDNPSYGISVGGVSAYATLTSVTTVLGVRFLKVSGNSNYLDFYASATGEGSSSGITYVSGSAYVRGMYGSYSYTSQQNLEIAAYKAATVNVLRNLGWK